nr:MAG TPA: hypothetical protein [Bacteriophage sp.]
MLLKLGTSLIHIFLYLNCNNRFMVSCFHSISP